MFSVRMPGRSHTGPLPPLSDVEREAEGHLRAHVRHLAGTIGERNLWHSQALEAAADYVKEALGRSGNAHDHTYACQGTKVRNIVAERRGQSADVVVVGAHYDSVRGSPGANDNGSGVAALLEIAERLRSVTCERTLRFVGFVNEEPPFFETGEMGSQAYARLCHERGERVVAMLSLETIGCYFDAPGTQQYPDLLSAFYPREGNFVAFVGNGASRGLVHDAIAAFRRTTAFPSEGIAAPGWVPGIAWSDHGSFWEFGYPALMVTDTAPFRYPQYHTAEDTPDHVDYERLARVTVGLTRVVAALAGVSPAALVDLDGGSSDV